MAELEAITSGVVPKSGVAKPEVFGRRFPLPLDTPVTLGRSAETADLAVPDDQMISGSSFHATLTWDGTKLVVAEKGNPHKNRVRLGDTIVTPDTPPARYEIPLGGSFRIGQTVFTVYTDGEGVPSDPADGTIAWTAAANLQAGQPEPAFANPPVVLAALAELSRGLRTRPNEQARIKHMLMVAVSALPRADAAGLVFVPPDATAAQPKLGVRESYARLAPGVNPGGPGAAAKSPFAPSRRLVHQAVTERKSLLHVWQPGPGDGPIPTVPGAEAVTMPPPSPAGAAPWAVCAPLQQGTRMALYVSGHLRPGESPSQRAVADELVGYQKVAELLAGLLEVTRQTHRLSEENSRFRPFVPKLLRDRMADPDKATSALDAREAELVVLFCDLRNYTKFLASQHRPLEECWREVANHLNLMTTIITAHGGVVCRILGDAILAVWGWPDPAGPDADRLGVARAAGEIQSGIKWMRQLQCGIGVACGRALVGRLGTEHLAQFDLYGEVANLAARLEAMTKAFGVSAIVTDEVAERLRREECPTRTRRLGRVRAKGLEGKPCEVHELLPEDKCGDHDWSDWDGLVEAFTAGRWAEAAEQLTMFYADDAAALCLLREMNRHHRRPPAGWDGAFNPAAPV